MSRNKLRKLALRALLLASVAATLVMATSAFAGGCVTGNSGGC